MAMPNIINVNLTFCNGRIALRLAAGKGHIDVAKLLLDSKADVNAGPYRSHGTASGGWRWTYRYP